LDDFEIEEKFDVITLFHVLEHFDDPRAVLKQLKSMLAKGGIIVIEVPNADDALLFDVHKGPYRLGDRVRGYAAPTGVCVDLAAVLMALDIPIRLDKKSRRAPGWVRFDRVPYGRYSVRVGQLAADAIKRSPVFAGAAVVNDK